MSTNKSWIGEDGSEVTLDLMDEDIFLRVGDGRGGKASVFLDEAEAREVLGHLNRLLGNLLSYGAPTA